ncbi:MAG TPA: hypothetical protein VFR11_15385 [Micromonosporaceae bacterium]|nr:hypothetical protein [Micromonosporaceae bacterium]
MQNLVLGLGAAVMAVAIGLTPFIYTSLSGGIKTLILASLTVVALVLPIWIARRGLTTTAEWIAPLGMVLILLDAEELWVGGLRRLGLSATVYAGLATLVAAIVAYLSHEVSKLSMLRFTAAAFLQPVLPLLLYPWLVNTTSWASALAAVAAVDLVIAQRTRQRYPDGRYLRIAVRVLQEVVTGGAIVLATIALIRAHDARSATHAGAALMASAVTGLAAGLLFRHLIMRDVWAGIAAIASVLCFGRIGALAEPGLGLITTSLALVATAVLVRALPGYARLGGRIGGAAAVAFTAALIAVRGWSAFVGPIDASTPTWNASLARYSAVVAEHVPANASQVVSAVVLTTFGAMIMASPAWRRVSLVGGITTAAVLAPGAWHLPWPAAIAAAGVPAIALGAFNLTAANKRESWIGVAAALVSGGYAAVIAMAQPIGQAVVLLVFGFAGIGIGYPVLGMSLRPQDRSPRVGVEPGAAAVVAPPSKTPPVAPLPTDDGPPALVDELLKAPASARPRSRPWLRWFGVTWTGNYDTRAGDAAWGAAALALPGFIAAFVASLAPETPPVSAILAASFLMLAAVLVAVALSQVARIQRTPLTVGGATLASLVIAIAAVRTSAAQAVDVGISLLLLATAIVLSIAPSLTTGVRLPGRFVGRGAHLFWLDSDEVAAAVATAAAIASVARVASLAAPSLVMVAMAVVVLCAAAGTRALPAPWRAGPTAGAWLIGLGIAVIASVHAIHAAIAVVVQVNHPIWDVDPHGWGAKAALAAGDVAQASLSLVLLAAAAAVVLPPLQRKMAVAVTLGLALLAAPAALHTPLNGPVIASGIGATVAGLVAARSAERGPSMVCGTVASLLFGNTIVTSLTSSANTVVALVGSAAVNAIVAFTAAGTVRRIEVAARQAAEPQRALPGRVDAGAATGAGATAARADAARGVRVAPSPVVSRPVAPRPVSRRTGVAIDVEHLVMLGGGSLGAGMIAFASAAGVVAAAGHKPMTVVLAAFLAGLSLALALVAGVAKRLAALLPFASGAVSIAGLGVGLAALWLPPANRFTDVGIFAAGGALLAVVAEMIRSSVVVPPPRRVIQPVPRPVRLPRERHTAVLLAAGPAATLALATLANSVLAALIGPYRWAHASMVWTGPPNDSVDALGGWAHRLISQPAGIGTAILLTAAGALTAIGFGGSRQALIGRTVAVVVPGLAVTLLLTPYLVRAPWPYGPIAAVTVAAICHLALALTRELPESEAASALRAARQTVIGIAVASGGAGIAGGLATPATTIATVATATGAGTVAAVWGRIPISRIAGWILAAAGAQSLALVICLDEHLAPYNAAFVVGGVAAALLIAAALLPSLRRREALAESLTVEISAYAGAVVALILAAKRLDHLAIFLSAWGAVLGVAAARQRRSNLYRHLLLWHGALHLAVGLCLLVKVQSVGIPEAYSLTVAAVAVVAGWFERRWHPELTSWVTYGVALTAALAPSLVIEIATGQTLLRRTLLLAGAAGVTVFGAIRRQQAPVIIGAVTLLGATINELARYSTTALILVLMAIIAAVLIGVGATYEKRSRNLQRVRNLLDRLQ